MGRHRNGMLLITSLIIIAIMAMFMAVVVSDLNAGMFFTRNYAQQEQAYWAALSGLEYAKHMILLNWRWHGNSTAVPIDSAGIFIEESYEVNGVKQYGAVHGTIEHKEAEFYISFADITMEKGDRISPLKDRDGQYLTYYSHNKLSSLYSMELPIDMSGKTRTVLPRCVYIAVEGRSDSSKSFVEAIYSMDYSPSLPAAAISSGQMKISMKDADSELLFTHSAGDNPNIRSNESIIASDGTGRKKLLDLSEGKAVAKDKIIINNMDVNENNQTDFGINAQLHVDSSEAFPRLTWDKVMESNGNPDGGSSSYGAKMKAGIYAFMEDKNKEGSYDLVYFKEDYSDRFDPNKSTSLSYTDYVKGISVPKGGVNLSAAELQIGTNKRTAVEKIDVDPKTSIDSLAVINYDWDAAEGRYVASTDSRAKVILHKNADVTQPTTLCSNGSILVKGELSGTGSVITGESLSFEPSSQLTPSPEIGLAIYAKGDIKITDITASESVPDPGSYINNALNAYIQTNGDRYQSLYTTTYKLLRTEVETGDGQKAPLNDVLSSQYNYSHWDSLSIVMQVLRQNSERKGMFYTIIPPDDSSFNPLKPTDAVIKGVIYTWQNFKTDLYGGSLTIRGAIVAYGGDPSSQNPGSIGDSGKVEIKNGKFVNIIYDPNYLELLGISGLSVTINQVMFNRM